MSENKNQGQWYVAITRDRASFYNFMIAYGEQIESAKALVKRRRLEIVAEKEELTESDMDYITGAIVAGSDDRGIGAVVTGIEHLANLTRLLNKGKISNPQNVLDAIYESKP